MLTRRKVVYTADPLGPVGERNEVSSLSKSIYIFVPQCCAPFRRRGDQREGVHLAKLCFDFVNKGRTEKQVR
jgi:hypothetical protein